MSENTKENENKEYYPYSFLKKHIKYTGPKQLTNYKVAVLERDVEKQFTGKSGKEFTCRCLKVGIFKDDNQIGEYYRNYDMMFSTFLAFEYKGKEYAIYSEMYDEISVMSLPDCNRIVLDNTSEFCPIDFKIIPVEFVPYNIERKEIINNYIIEYDVHFIWTIGCIWGGPIMLQMIDISEIENGKITLLKRCINDEELLNHSINDTIFDCELTYDYETKQSNLEMDIATKKHVDIPTELAKVKFKRINNNDNNNNNS